MTCSMCWGRSSPRRPCEVPCSVQDDSLLPFPLHWSSQSGGSYTQVLICFSSLPGSRHASFPSQVSYIAPLKFILSLSCLYPILLPLTMLCQGIQVSSFYSPFANLGQFTNVSNRTGFGRKFSGTTFVRILPCCLGLSWWSKNISNLLQVSQQLFIECPWSTVLPMGLWGEPHRPVFLCSPSPRLQKSPFCKRKGKPRLERH